MLTEYRRRYREWAEKRPTMGPYCLAISAFLIARPPVNGFQVGDLVLTLSSISGVSTMVLAIIMGVCAVAGLLGGRYRLITGLVAMVTALVAFPAANFGGYIFGTVFGIVGASLILAWQPYDRKAPLEAPAAPDDHGDPATEQLPPAVDDQPTEVIPALEEPVDGAPDTAEAPGAEQPPTTPEPGPAR